MGGSGYIREFAVEQFLRDSRIAPIWEGTNGIQALDLVGRKIPKNMGRSLREFLWPIQEFVATNRDDPEMAPFTKPLHQGVRGLQQLTMLMMTKGAGDPYFPAAGATEFTRFFGNVVLASMWARIVKVCLPKRDEDPFYAAKIATARVFFDRVYPETLALAAKVQAGHRSLTEYPEEMM
jgi:butyryl-CoA dehydrogenase